MASDEEVKLNYEENIEWNVENEIRLFEALIGHKPVGINKHFHMACISEKFKTLMGKPVPSELIWKHLGSMFDLAALDKKESLPFPNEQEEFSLPETEFSDLISEKLAGKTESTTDAKENSKEAKPLSKVVKDFTPARDQSLRKEKKSETEQSDSGLSSDVEKKDTTESEIEAKKGKTNKEEKAVKRRGNRNMRDKKSEEALHVNKKEEDTQSAQSDNRKEKRTVGKRSLRSRIDDSVSSKSLTPPPVKRARRI